MTWTNERIAILTDCAAANMSASEIAKTLGGVTRNAVIGKISRLAGVKLGRAQGERGHQVNVIKLNAKPGRKPVARKLPEPAAIIDEAGDHFTLETIALEHQCRWPIGDPRDREFHFCGRRRWEKSPYCESHHRKGHQPPPPDKKDEDAAR